MEILVGSMTGASVPVPNLDETLAAILPQSLSHNLPILGHGYPLIVAIWTPIAREGETLIRDRVELLLMMAAPISACLSCPISRLSITSQGP